MVFLTLAITARAGVPESLPENRIHVGILLVNEGEQSITISVRFDSKPEKKIDLKNGELAWVGMEKLLKPTPMVSIVEESGGEVSTALNGIIRIGFPNRGPSNLMTAMFPGTLCEEIQKAKKINWIIEEKEKISTIQIRKVQR